MKDKFEQLKKKMEEITDLQNASAVLGWDRQTMMPPAGAAARARQMATLSRLIHERYTRDEIGELLEELDEWAGSLDYDSDEAGLVRHVQREFCLRRAVPSSLVAELAQTAGIAYSQWVQSRQNNDFASFLPYLEKLFDLRRQYAECFPQRESLYDPLIDQFEEGMTTAELRRIFGEVKGPQAALLQAIMNSEVEIDDGLLHQHFPHAAQLAAGLEIAEVFGYDLRRGRMDLTTHPFATSFSVNDVRITTRVDEHFLNSCLFSVMHEAGHALYELGVAQHLEGLPLARGTSSAIHESQSRLFENLIGRSRAFAHHLLPLLQKHFPSQLGETDVESFYRAINKVQPSLIRVEADEVSYNLHIILRFELEVEVIEGRMAVRDLPEAWNEKMRAYLGIVPPDDAHGVLQDVHWSVGMVGHFSTYALGNIIASQFWARMGEDLPERENDLARGNVAPVLAWLREQVHQHGRKYPPAELVQRITGEPINTRPYLDYLQHKFGEMYALT